jgi:uncharacterized protein DUF6719
VVGVHGYHHSIVSRIKSQLGRDVQAFRFQNRPRLPRFAQMTISRALLSCLLLIAAVTPAAAMADQVAREQDIAGLRLGQRVLVDDGTCGAGQIKEVSGAKMTPSGVLASRRCIPRLGPKKK